MMRREITIQLIEQGTLEIRDVRLCHVDDDYIAAAKEVGETVQEGRHGMQVWFNGKLVLRSELRQDRQRAKVPCRRGCRTSSQTR